MERFERLAWIAMAVGGLVMGGVLIEDSTALGLVVAFVMLLAAWWMAPWRGRSSVRHEDLDTVPAERRQVVVYWRPGCMYCARLTRTLGTRRNRATWVNIWQDDAAERFVRGVNQGNATVPTVVIDGEPVTNPDPRTVLRRLG